MLLELFVPTCAAPSLHKPFSGCCFLHRVELPVFPSNKTHRPQSQSVLFLSQSGGATGLPRVSCPAHDHPAAPPTYLPQSDVSELWISLDSSLWNMNFPKKTLEKNTSPSNLINHEWRPTSCVRNTEPNMILTIFIFIFWGGGAANRHTNRKLSTFHCHWGSSINLKSTAGLIDWGYPALESTEWERQQGGERGAQAALHSSHTGDGGRLSV